MVVWSNLVKKGMTNAISGRSQGWQGLWHQLYHDTSGTGVPDAFFAGRTGLFRFITFWVKKNELLFLGGTTAKKLIINRK